MCSDPACSSPKTEGLPYGGDLKEAMRCQDRAAIRQIMAFRKETTQKAAEQTEQAAEQDTEQAKDKDIKLSRRRRRLYGKDWCQFYEQGYDAQDRPKPGAKPIKTLANTFVELHKSRRIKHIIDINDPSLRSKLEMIADTMKVEYPSLYREFILRAQCCKDRGHANKECKFKLDPYRLVKMIQVAIPKCDADRQEDVRTCLNMFEARIMDVLLAEDLKLRDRRGYALYSICPLQGCPCATGYRIPNPGSVFVQCPSCGTEYCTKCSHQHLPNERCVLPDPRAQMSPEELEGHDNMVADGEEQWCTCGAIYGKDDACDSVHCARAGCRRHFCFGCGEEIDNYYTANHTIMGPPEEANPEGQWRCVRTLVRRAVADKPSHREWLIASLDNDRVRSAISFILRDPLRPLADPEREYLQSVQQLI